MASKVITIDGPAGAGKTTVARALAEELGFVLLDSGALYRAVALVAVEREVPLDDDSQLEAIARGLNVRFEIREGAPRIWLGEREVTSEIRTQEISDAASRVSARPRLRAALLSLQRELGEGQGLVAEGRDMGTVVFPDALVKIFLIASAEERARRRTRQLRESGVESAKQEEVEKEQAVRDRRDSEREVAPLRAAGDAVALDTTALSLEEVVAKVRGIVRARLGRS